MYTQTQTHLVFREILNYILVGCHIKS